MTIDKPDSPVAAVTGRAATGADPDRPPEPVAATSRPPAPSAPLANPEDPGGLPPGFLRLFDVVVTVGLVIFSYRVRKDGMPTTGLWFDDSWVAAGARYATPSNLMMTGSGHPGFTALLAVIDRIVGGIPALAAPALVAGSLGATAAYWFSRKLSLSRAVSLLLASVLAVAPVHILYSARVKSYVLDTIFVMLLAVLVSRLAAVRWTWRIAVGWLALVWVLSTFSGYLLVSTAIASAVLVLHAEHDRWTRVAVTALQGVVQLGYFLVARSKTDLDGIEGVMESAFDGHMTFHANPIDFVHETLKHLHRVGEVYPSGPEATTTALVVVALAGLLVGSVGHHHRLRLAPKLTVACRYLLALVAFAFAGSMVDRFPFGTTNSNPLSYGGRHTLWMVPAILLGLGVVLDLLRSLLIRRSTMRVAVNGVAGLVVLTVLIHGTRDPLPHPQKGSGELVPRLEEVVGPDDVVYITSSWTFLYMVSTSTLLELVATPDHQVGFAPVYADERFHSIGNWGSEPMERDEVLRETRQAVRVHVVGGGYGHKQVDTLNAWLEDAGFRSEWKATFGSEYVYTWVR